MLRVRTIAVINQKGGVGKTTTVANLGAAVAARGRGICLIDLDPQSHLTLHFGLEPGSTPKSMYDVLTSETAIAAATMTISANLWLVPSVIDLAAAEIELVGTVGREQILRDRLLAHPVPYELVLIDCPPSLGLLTLNALAAADEVLIPLQPHFLGLQGLGKLLETVSLVQRRINPKLRVSGVVLCLYEKNTRLAGEVVADLQNFFAAARNTPLPWADARIFNSVIRRNIKLAESPSYGKTIFDYEPLSKGAADYNALADEFLGAPAPLPAAQPSQVQAAASHAGADEAQVSEPSAVPGAPPEGEIPPEVLPQAASPGEASREGAALPQPQPPSEPLPQTQTPQTLQPETPADAPPGPGQAQPARQP